MTRQEILSMILEIYNNSDELNKLAILTGLIELVPFEKLQAIKKADDLLRGDSEHGS